MHCHQLATVNTFLTVLLMVYIVKS